ncbi:efflux transporter, RND family, MFP subunit [Thioalkalivibrio nitratireducens DSM 14787]|uniref:Efflux transporter, RND family, MFP subunit n=1 Tax=Thioalkalivibrio nitratireducens (strain DSM 14787 / UNIQEM 213 / ALEN2) TaxID=1255043 RepID=L0DZG7_THIND|nr:HlyD family efflux transporter periplasmic adaptor subunit [Thioalkalivibrio nitratireducens]AGA34433.1 efflux transporter, RND family, MFP subunit [Thioalkalivibrio nitratireducens DSM 14787]
MKWRKKTLWALVLLAAAGLLAWALMPAPVPVSATEVRSGAFVESVEEEGRTRLRDTFTVSAPIAGYLQRVALEAGDPVELAQVVFRMEPLPAPALDARSLEQARENLSAARARLETARANLETERAEASFAESEFERYRQLRERELVSATEMERARSARDRQRAVVRAAEHSVQVARSEVESARAVLDIASGTRPGEDQPLLEVRSPSAGVVLHRHRCCEGAIQAGEPVLEVGDLADLEIQVDLLSMDAVRVRSGMRVTIGGWGGDELLQGRVRRVEPAGFTRVSALGVDEQRVPVIVDFADVQQAAERLGVGFRVEAEFVLWEGEDVTQVPTSALFRVDGRWAVFVVTEGRARERSVQPGRRSGMISQIVDGLSPGETVVTHPGDRVRDGVRVQPQRGG